MLSILKTIVVRVCFPENEIYGEIMKFLDLNISSIVLDPNKNIIRQAPRLEKDQQDNYKELFDYYTLFSDIFYNVDGDIELLGPPLLNLKDTIQDAQIYINNKDVTKKVEFIDANRISRSIIRDSAGSDSIQIEFDDYSFIKKIQPNMSSFFTNKNVLVTQQRDNPIEWIVYWIMHHIEHNKINAVLIYDNGSQGYCLDELKSAIDKIDKIDKACVVDWKTPWGPTGGHNQVWDSDYGQHQSWEHALKRLLADANCAIIGDVDELPLHQYGLAIPDILEGIEQPVLSYYRRNIVDVGLDSAIRLHSDTFMFEEHKPLAGTKYSISPRRLSENTQLLVHRVVGSDTYQCDDIISSHFGSLRVDWRNGNYSQRPLKKISQFSNLQEDEVLIESFRKIDNEQVKKIIQL